MADRARATAESTPDGSARVESDDFESVGTPGAAESVGGPDSLDLAGVQAVFERARSEVVDGFTDRLAATDRFASALGESDLTMADVEQTVRAVVEDLTAESYPDSARERRMDFGRECASENLPIAPVLSGFDAYLTAVEPHESRGPAESDGTRADEAGPDVGAEPCDVVQRIRTVARIAQFDARLVADGYVDALVGGISRERLSSRVQEIQQQHLGPVEASATVVKRASNDVCELVEEQTSRTTRVSEDVATMSATVEEIASSASQVEAVAEDAQQRAIDGQAAAEEAISVMGNIEDASEGVADDIRSLERRVKDIDEIVEVINDIAEQTNMLALNANIEAARAGEAGDGFAVVAGEVKSLAEESQQQAAEIEAMIEDIQSVTSQTVESLQRTNEQVTDGVSQVEQTLIQLEEIVDAVTEATDGVGEIAGATEEQAERAETVAATVDEIANRAEDVQTEIDRIAAANDEQAAKLENLSDAIGDLDSNVMEDEL